jgi:ABC-type iron transport system FetAB ATPase subunit
VTDRLRLEGLRGRLAGPFDLTIEPGECVAVSGASGAGKTVFLRMIADLDPNEGELFLDGVARETMPAPTWRRQVAYLAAESGWWDDAVAPHFADLAAARALAVRLELRPDLLDGPVLRLSTGEKQRLALARTLLLGPPVLLLDEPTGALDESSRGAVEGLLRERLDAGCAILLVTHDPAQAARLARRRFVIAGGRLHPQ